MTATKFMEKSYEINNDSNPPNIAIIGACYEIVSKISKVLSIQ